MNTPKRLLLVASMFGFWMIFSTGNLQAKRQETYLLDWKLAQGEVVAYKTAMNAVATPSVSFNFDGNNKPEDLGNLLSNISVPQVGSLITLLETNARGNVSIKMILHEIMMAENASQDEISQAFSELAQSMQGTIQLRGEVTPDGAIASFYLAETQRNLIALFFELPTSPVQLGDKWSLDFNCISMGHGFIINAGSKINEVVLADIVLNSDGQTVAILDYLMVETVEGKFQPAFSSEFMPSSMTCTFFGRGEFLVDQGRWQKFTGEMAIKSTGIMAANNVQQFALLPLNDIPPEYLELE